MRHKLKRVTRCLAAVGLLLVVVSDANAQDGIVDLLWSVPAGDILVNDTFTVGLVARGADTPLIPEPFAALEAVLQWDPTRITLLGIDSSQDEYAWLSSTLPAVDAGGLNLTFLDGDALYQALGQFDEFNRPVASIQGLLVTNFVFRALRTGAAQINTPTELGEFARTVVLDDLIPGLDILGTTSPGSVNIVIPEPTTAVLLLVLSSGLVFGRRRRLSGASGGVAAMGVAS